MFLGCFLTGGLVRLSDHIATSLDWEISVSPVIVGLAFVNRPPNAAHHTIVGQQSYLRGQSDTAFEEIEKLERAAT